jgi:hypothetical protein
MAALWAQKKTHKELDENPVLFCSFIHAGFTHFMLLFTEFCRQKM